MPLYYLRKSANHNNSSFGVCHLQELAWTKKDRDFLKHTRDIEQSKLVTKIITEYMPNIDIEKEISAIKHMTKEVVVDYMDNIYSKVRSNYNL